MNMDEKSDSDKSFDDFMMPGFRFHPTDEELVEFYLKRKLQNRPLPIELIKQVDIYKYDPWDLPKVASTGEKEWYFYCPRDRKYRNSTRPNRVTGSGFWKATGTDRPIYSSDGNKCIGLKKSLVFYRGRAARGMKTDWMMHEFRLPAAPDGGAPPPLPPKRVFDKNIPATDSWAICRIFKKTNSMANRALSHSWAASFSETTPTCAFTYANFNSENDLQQALNFPSYKNLSAATGKTSALTSANFDYFPENIIFSPSKELSDTSKNTTLEITPTIFNLSPAIPGEANFETPPHEFNGGYSVNVEDDQDGFKKNQSTTNVHNLWENVRSIGFPFSLPPALPWDSPACPSEISSASYSTNRCYI